MDLQDETNRLLASLIRMQTDSQAAAIVELDRAGIPHARIAELLGTTPATARDAVKRAKKARASKGGKK